MLPIRLGVFTGDVYWREGDTISTNVAFVHFLEGLAPRVRELTLFGRLDPEPRRASDVVRTKDVRFVPLPHYRRLTQIGAVLAARRGSRRVFASELARLDAVWSFGPHPLALDLVRLARRSRVPVLLGVRQDFPEYARHRLTGLRRVWGVPAAHVLDHAFRRLARGLPTVVVGAALARRYEARGAPQLQINVSLVRAHEIVPLADALAKSWDSALEVLHVGRLEEEKNPLLLPAVLAELRRREPRWRLTVAGDGPLRPALERRADQLGVADSVELRGYVAQGSDLRELYRSSHAFLHVSRTEGLPQVLAEAAAAGLPIVATDVGGVAGAVGDGARGLLVPPDDAGAAADALERLRLDAGLRETLIERGLEHARATTLDHQMDELVEFLAIHVLHLRHRGRAPEDSDLSGRDEHREEGERSAGASEEPGAEREPGGPEGQ